MGFCYSKSVHPWGFSIHIVSWRNGISMCVCTQTHDRQQTIRLAVSGCSSCDHPGEQELQARQEAGGAHSSRHVRLEFGFTFILSVSQADDFQAG